MHRIFDHVLDSEISFPELPVIHERGLKISIQVGGKLGLKNQPAQWLHEWLNPQGNVAVAIGHVNDDYFLRFPDVAEFLVSLENNTIQCFFDSDTPLETIRHLLLDQVIPRILGQQGRLVLHAGCVKLADGDGVAFLGDSGWGKSTLAASFHQSGLQLLTDDCLLIDIQDNQVTGIPNYTGARLFGDSIEQLMQQSTPVYPVAHYSDKKRLIMHDGQDVGAQGVPLKAIFLLEDPVRCAQYTTVNVERVTGTQEIMEILKSMFLLDVTDKQLQVSLFKKVGELLVCGVPIYRLGYPRDYSLLPMVRDLMIETLNF